MSHTRPKQLPVAMSAVQRPSLVLAPSINTTRVVTTTTTTTTYAPIPLPALPPPSEPKDPKNYPLLYSQLPQSLRKFDLTFPNGAHATFYENEDDQNATHDDEVYSGQGWRMVRRGDEANTSRSVGLAEALEGYSRKRSLSSDHLMQGVEASTPPPRKKARPAFTVNPMATMNTAGPPSPLPSPHGSPTPESIWPSAPPSGASSPTPPGPAPVQPDISLMALLTLPQLLSHFSALPPSLQSHLLLTLLRQSPLPVLRNIHSILTPTLARDFLTLLPPEIVSIILSHLPVSALNRCSRVSKSWRAIIDSDPVLWRELLKSRGFWFGGESELAFSNAVHARRRHTNLAIPDSLPLPHPFKMLFKSRHLTRSRWQQNVSPKRLSFAAHGSSVVTCLLFSHGRIISASDDHSIHVYSPTTGQLVNSLDGHEGGVWALAATKNTLVSGSTDRTVRIWDLAAGRCTHVFGGHTSTVRCLAIVKPEWIDIPVDGGGIRRERWPKRPLIVTGSRDHSLRVWSLPKPGDDEYRCYGVDDADADPQEDEVDDNPFHKLFLEGHEHAVRALAARGRTLVSGSYDCTVRIWDIITGECKWVLLGHSQKVYSVVLDPGRNQACSGSMDGSVRIWNLSNGTCVHTLQGHTSLVGLLGLSPNYLVSAAADSTLRIWDPETGQLRHTLVAHTGAITCFQHDEFKVLSGSDGTLKMWDIEKGTVMRDLLTGITGVWQVVFEGRWCVAASNRSDTTYLDVWDFGHDETDEEWVGEPVGGIYDEDSDGEDTESDPGDMDIMDEDLAMIPPGPENTEEMTEEGSASGADDDDDDIRDPCNGELEDDHQPRSRWATSGSIEPQNTSNRRHEISMLRNANAHRHLARLHRPPTLDETPTRPRRRR